MLSAVLIAGCVLVLYMLLRCSKKRNWKVMRFYRPTCGACQSSQSEWDMFKYKHNLQGIFVHDVNLDNPDPDKMELARRFNIKGVPMVVAVDQAGNYKIFEGVRTYNNYRKWAEML